MGDQRSYAEVVKDANQQLDNMAGEGSHVRVADDVLAGKKEEGNPKKVKSPQSANIPELKEDTDPMWGAAAAAAGEEFSEAERETSSSSEEVCVWYKLLMFI